MPTTLISQFTQNQNPITENQKYDKQYLSISELFCDTIQGEGVHSGMPATFLRLKGCTLSCSWCDTLEVWKHGSDYSFDQIFDLFETTKGLIERFKKGQHLVLTGGSPLMQQKQLVDFLECFYRRFGFTPYIECENEVMLEIEPTFDRFVDCWNNSPKLANSGMKERIRYKPELIKQFERISGRAWFKFVINDDMDWKEIKQLYLDKELISRSQIVLMPCGQTQEELAQTREFVADLAVRENVRFSDRLHVTIWNKKTGV